ncbi:hypothetical protein KZX50_00535 [Bacillus infantis]|uniref:hypothetical protein n=1 Tax=Bacillus infantis TaxID=324767 RepID=UPI002005D43D|nr:hypothetical protein [Bacillus infantis]MCK6203934.1 hypothetical protein [Bacillus infantis]
MIVKPIANHSELLSLDLQFFSEEVPAAEPVDVPESTDIPDVPQDEPESFEEAPSPQDDFFEVKYNKENMRISRDEAPTYIQKGLNYDKVSQKATEYERQLHDLATLTGYQDVQEMIQAAEEARKQAEIQQAAQRYGISEESYMQHFEPVNQELNQLKSELQTIKQEETRRKVEQEVNELRSKHEDFGDYEDRVFDLAIQRGYTLEDAYKLVSFEDKMSNIQKQTEEKVVNQIRSRQGKHVETHDENTAVSLNLSPEEMAYAQKMGLSPEEYSKYKA